MLIDAHTHIFPSEIRDGREKFFKGEPDFELLYADPRSKLVSGDILVEKLDQWGFDAAVSFGFPWNAPETSTLNNDYVLESARAHPGRIVPFACVNPLAPGAVKEAERCLKAGAKGLGEIATYKEGLGEHVRAALAPLAELAREADVPLMLHTNEPVGHSYPGKSRQEMHELYALIANHRDTKWILAHWGGGLFFYNLLKKEAEEVLKNVYYDTAAGPYLYKPEVYNHFIAIAGADKLLYGSDYPLLGPERYRADMKAAGLDAKTVAAALGGNAVLLLGLGGK
jgi:predicted TIM-barrel fold metal-dependent hydrolase